MTLSLIASITLVVLFVSWFIYEVTHAPTENDAANEWHDECVKSREEKQ